MVDTVPSTALSGHKQLFGAWLDFNGASRSNVELSTYKLILEAHPEYHTTRVEVGKCDLMGFAKAGHATAAQDRDDGLYDGVRAYYNTAKSKDGTEKKLVNGYLSDQIYFSKWRYTWDGLDYLIYTIAYNDAYGRYTKMNFVLAPYSEELVKGGVHANTDKLLIAAGKWTKDLHDEIYVFDDSSWGKSNELWRSVQGATWEDVILEPALKHNLTKDVLNFFDNRDIYKSMTVPWKRGIILHGVPGNGKTITIKALINSLAARSVPIPSLYVKSFDSCNGAKWSIEKIFSHARKMAPCLLIFEDLDSLVEEKTRSYFLNEVDGLESNEGILMIGSTNHLERLDASITKRPSRFDRKYHFKVPNEASRAAYARFWHRKFASKPDAVDFPDEICDIVAKLTEGFSFAYMQELFMASLLELSHGDDGGYLEEEEVPSSSDSGSTTDAVVVEHPSKAEDSDAVSDEEGGEGKDEGESDKDEDKKKEKKKAAPPKPKRVIPSVEVPDHLQDNGFLRILTKQAKILLEQMDNTEDEPEAAGSKVKGERAVVATRILKTVRIARRARA
ncbi:proteasome-activating nucleotidase [Lasiosphaeria ovina]|uniref:Proteasome-activating nucleotidase n=1 Tax=Lasiosphaeria ovina TaxID=92902 RepID=A0AAE0JSY5_9PEZI|nr:proteasome-activating nucleotidase [Lasiosphaeria ovina]